MTPEQKVAAFAVNHSGADVPDEVRTVVRNVLRTIVGTMAAGAAQDGVAELRSYVRQQGGAAEARSLIFGDPLPAVNAALFNATMARALDYCDLMVPGLHLGSSVVPAALAAAELKGDCTGTELEEALIVGLEIGATLCLNEEQFDGFDPTGVVGVIASAATVGRILQINENDMLNALALAFNRSAGSFQANVDASLAVRFIQGFAASNAVQAVQLAQLGITGPENFLAGRFGYTHLWGRDEVKAEDLVSTLGSDWKIVGDFFKKYPCCGLAQGPTDLVFESVSALGAGHEEISEIELRLPEFAYSLIGRPFELGSNPRVNAQFSARYCMVNALVRGSSRLAHFEPDAVAEIKDHPLFSRINVLHDPTMDGHSESHIKVTMIGRDTWEKRLPVGPGYPGNPLTEEEHSGGFNDCLDYAPYPLDAEQRELLVEAVDDIRGLPSVEALVKALISKKAPQ